MDQSFEVGIADRPYCRWEIVLMVGDSQNTVKQFLRRLAYLTVYEKHFLVYLSKR